MPKVNYIRKDNSFYEAILRLESVEEAIGFFDDVCSPTELASIEQRFEVARELYRGEVYKKIAEQTGASSATIMRVNRVYRGGNGCLAAAIDKIKSEE